MLDFFQKKKQDIYLFLFDLLMVFLPYSIFLRRHFSVDSYAVYFNMDADNQIRQVRLVNYFFIKFFELIGFNTCKEQWLLTTIFIITAAFSTFFLTKIFVKYIENLTITKVLTINLAILISVINVFILEWFLYPEIMLFYAISLMFSVFAIGIIDLNGKCFVRYFIALIFLLISLNSYQASMPIYVIYGITLFLVKNKFTLNKKAFIESLLVVFSAGFSSICILVEQKIAVSFGGNFTGDREAQFSIETVINNVKTIISDLDLIFNGYRFLPKFIIPVFITCIFMIMVYVFIKTESKAIQYLYLGLVIVVNFLINFVPHIITKQVWFAPRTVVGIGAFLSIIVIIALIKANTINSDVIYKISAIISALFILINFVQIQDVGKNHYINNALEYEYAILIQDEINKYEAETGNHIDSIATVTDKSPQYNYAGVRYTIFDTNVKAFIVQWGTPFLIGYYNDRYYNMTNMDEQIYNEYFLEKDWNKFIPEEQMIFIDNTLYLCVY